MERGSWEPLFLGEVKEEIMKSWEHHAPEVAVPGQRALYCTPRTFL
jgi:hypothetical protein